MVKFITKIIDSKVVLFQEGVIMAEALDVLIDPDDGSFVGLEVFLKTDKRRMFVPSSEIKGFGQGLVVVKDFSSFVLSDEVVRIGKVIEKKTKIIGSRVFYDNGEYVGKVEDATISFEELSLKNIYISPKFSIKFLAENLIISAKMITRIEKNKIYIKNTDDKIKAAKAIVSPSPAVD
ncbi:MAG: PRC-barrel domain-containing protein [Patescibacteria group bacterium]|nr:PRC-barrel domain-containing protein [Patescibacteria group bacterium]